MAEQGWLRKRMRADGNTYFWCYQKTRPSDGKRVEQPVRLGLVADIGNDAGAWREVGRLNLIEKYLMNSTNGQPTFGWLARHYAANGLPFNKRTGGRKSKGAIYCYERALDNFILPRWENEIASRIKPLAIRDWLYAIHDDEDYDWQTVSKIKMVMGQVYSHADMYDLDTCRNPVEKVRIPGSEGGDRDVRVLKPEETLEIVSRLEDPEKVLVVLVAVTALRISEALALQWRHIQFDKGSISIEQAYRLSEITTTKTKSSKASVPMCATLAGYLRHWRGQSAYTGDSDFVFASDKLEGKRPRCGQMVNRCYLKPAAIEAGIIKEGERFGFHSLRHSLSTWVNGNLKDVKIAQTLLRHSKPDLTASVYIHSVPEENLRAQEKYVAALALQSPVSDAVQ